VTLARQGLQVFRETLALLVTLVQQVRQGLLVKQDQLVILALLVIWAIQVKLVLLVIPAQLELLE